MITTILILVWMHFVSDFILQTDKMAINKSSSWKWLSIHIGVYTLPFFWFGWKFALVNAGAHFVTDAISSRMTTALWKKQQRHWFFVVIGADQAAHMTVLLLTMGLMT
jgi:hypothetical protein